MRVVLLALFASGCFCWEGDTSCSRGGEVKRRLAWDQRQSGTPKTVAGLVERVFQGAGVGHTNVELKTSGDKLTRCFLVRGADSDNGWKLKPGDPVTVHGYSGECEPNLDCLWGCRL